MQVGGADGPVLTAYHPVLMDGKYVFPGDVGRSVGCASRTVYNVVLKGRGDMVVGAVSVATLGERPAHILSPAIIGGWAPGLRHPFFNTEAVVRNLRSLKANDGRVRVRGGRRDGGTGLVCDFMQ